MKIAVYYSPHNRRSRIIADAMVQGIRSQGHECDHISSHSYARPKHDVALFYGLAEGLRRVLAEYPPRDRKAVYIDLGYWGRRKKTRWDGFHKLSVNDRHPTAYFQRHRHPTDRLERHGVKIKPWRAEGRHILVVGMSGKGAAAEGYRPQQWESEAIALLRRHTKRPIIYRPKPNYVSARRIEGTEFQRGVSLADALVDCHAVVAHHSNAAMEAICAGVPAFVHEGVSLPMGTDDLTRIESPRMPKGRLQWAADISYTQWSVEEMMTGQAWNYLVREGLLR